MLVPIDEVARLGGTVRNWPSQCWPTASPPASARHTEAINLHTQKTAASATPMDGTEEPPIKRESPAQVCNPRHSEFTLRHAVGGTFEPMSETTVVGAIDALRAEAETSLRALVDGPSAVLHDDNGRPSTYS